MFGVRICDCRKSVLMWKWSNKMLSVECYSLIICCEFLIISVGKWANGGWLVSSIQGMLPHINLKRIECIYIIGMSHFRWWFVSCSTFFRTGVQNGVAVTITNHSTKIRGGTGVFVIENHTTLYAREIIAYSYAAAHTITYLSSAFCKYASTR